MILGLSERGGDDQPDRADEFEDAERQPGFPRQRIKGSDPLAYLVEHAPYRGALWSIHARAIARLVRRHPRLNVEVSALGPEAIVSGVLGGGFDLGVVTTMGLDDEPRIAFEPLPQHAVYLACRPGHPLAGRKQFTLEDVLAYPLVAPPLRGKALVTALREKALGRIDPESGDFLPAVTVNSLDLRAARSATTESCWRARGPRPPTTRRSAERGAACR